MPDPVPAPAPAPAPAPPPEEHTRLKPAEKQALAAQLTSEVLQLKAQEADNAYQLGLRLARLHRGDLYRATGARTWDEYLANSVKLSKVQALKWMRVASHFSEAAVASYGVEVLDGYARSLDHAHQQPPADLGAVVVHTPGGDKPLGDLTTREAEAAFRAPPAATAIDPGDQAMIDTFTQALSKLGPEVHVSASGGKTGARVVFSVPVAKVAKMVQALSGGGAKPAAKKPSGKKKPAAKKTKAKKGRR